MLTNLLTFLKKLSFKVLVPLCKNNLPKRRKLPSSVLEPS